MAKPTREEIEQREAEEQARKAALLKEHELDGVHPTEGGRYRRVGDRLERVEEEETPAAEAGEHQES
jgi:hypothetical protein